LLKWWTWFDIHLCWSLAPWDEDMSLLWWRNTKFCCDVEDCLQWPLVVVWYRPNILVACYLSVLFLCMCF